MAALPTLLVHEERRRDQEAARVRHAEAGARHARAQAEQLGSYRSEYSARWREQLRERAAIEIVQCYRSFLQRLDQAIAQQARQVQQAEQRLAQARAVLLAQEQRCAAVRRLLERRTAAAQLATQRSEQKHADELALRMHRQRRSGATNPG